MLEVDLNLLCVYVVRYNNSIENDPNENSLNSGGIAGAVG